MGLVVHNLALVSPPDPHVDPGGFWAVEVKILHQISESVWAEIHGISVNYSSPGTPLPFVMWDSANVKRMDLELPWSLAGGVYTLSAHLSAVVWLDSNPMTFDVGAGNHREAQTARLVVTGCPASGVS